MISGPNNIEIGANSNAIYEMNCTDNFSIVEKDLTSNDFTVTGNISISSVTKTSINSGYKYTITILSGNTDTIGNIKLNSNVIQDVNGNYNNASNISNNVEVQVYKIFYITYNGTKYEYNFNDGMTWNDFISSSYNDGSFGKTGSNVYYKASNYEVRKNTTAVALTDLITENYTYTTFAWATSNLYIYNSGSELLNGSITSTSGGSYSGKFLSGRMIVESGSVEWNDDYTTGTIPIGRVVISGVDFTKYKKLIINAKWADAGDNAYNKGAYCSVSVSGLSSKDITTTSYSNYTFNISSLTGSKSITFTAKTRVWSIEGVSTSLFSDLEVRQIYLTP